MEKINTLIKNAFEKRNETQKMVDETCFFANDCIDVSCSENGQITCNNSNVNHNDILFDRVKLENDEDNNNKNVTANFNNCTFNNGKANDSKDVRQNNYNVPMLDSVTATQMENLRCINKNNTTIKTYNKHIIESNYEFLKKNAISELSSCHLIELPTQVSLPIVIDTKVLPFELVQAANYLSSKIGANFFGVFFSMIGAINCSLHGRFRAILDDEWSELVNLYMLVAAPSGARKSAIINAIKFPLLDFEKYLITNYSDSGNMKKNSILKKAISNVEKKMARQLCSQVESESFISNKDIFLKNVDCYGQTILEAESLLVDTKKAPRIFIDSCIEPGLSQILAEQ